jgi:hypothetical protein
MTNGTKHLLFAFHQPTGTAHQAYLRSLAQRCTFVPELRLMAF